MKYRKIHELQQKKPVKILFCKNNGDKSVKKDRNKKNNLGTATKVALGLYRLIAHEDNFCETCARNCSK